VTFPQVLQTIQRKHRTLALTVALTLMNPANGASEDRVTLLDRRDRLVTRSGEILTYDAHQLQLRLPQGTTQRVPTDRVVKIETEREAEHQQADEAFDRRDYASAFALYRSAYRSEMRMWTKQQIVARSVECLRQLGRFREATTTFLALWNQDPATPYFTAIPLAWRAEQVEREWESTALDWLDQSQPTVARLMAASWLLSGRHRTAAEKALVELTERETTNWIGQMAAAQRWRTRVVTAGRDEVLGWQSIVPRLPEGLRSGPSFVLAQALARHHAVDEAVLVYLRIALVDAPAGELAAESLWAAGQLLQQVPEPDEAQRIYRELIERHPDHLLVNEAQRAMRELDASP
jgi:tetratricopeptide (TPR) repeat protein